MNAYLIKFGDEEKLIHADAVGVTNGMVMFIRNEELILAVNVLATLSVEKIELDRERI